MPELWLDTWSTPIHQRPCIKSFRRLNKVDPSLHCLHHICSKTGDDNGNLSFLTSKTLIPSRHLNAMIKRQCIT